MIGRLLVMYAVGIGAGLAWAADQTLAQLGFAVAAMILMALSVDR